MKNESNENQLNNADVVAKLFEAIKGGNSVVYVNFTYIAIQHNHGQVNFSTAPSRSSGDKQSDFCFNDSNNSGNINL